MTSASVADTSRKASAISTMATVPVITMIGLAKSNGRAMTADRGPRPPWQGKRTSPSKSVKNAFTT